MLVCQIVEKMDVAKCIFYIFSIIKHSLFDNWQNVLLLDLVNYRVT